MKKLFQRITATLTKALTTVLVGAAVAGVLVLGGCSILGQPIAEKVADGIERYCQEAYEQRHVYRHSINTELAAEGHSIVVTCRGDPEPHE